MTKSISIVIPNYNGEFLLKKNIPYVYRALKTSNIEDFEIIVADDASTDKSIDFLKANYSQIIICENKINGGFSKNINSGIKKATKDLVLLLNSDVELTDNYFSHQLKYFEKPDTFGVMGKIVSIDNENKIQDFAKYPKFNFCKIKSTRNYMLINNSNNEPYYSFFLSGANALVDRNKLFELGLFNELYSPYYYEDVDLSLKAWRYGYKCYFDEKSVCRHPYSVTIKKYSTSKKVKLISRKNRFLLHFLHLDNFCLLFYFFCIISSLLVKTLVFNFLEIKAFYIFLKHFRQAIQSKKNFYNLCKKNQKKPLSISNVRNFILNTYSNHSIRIFK